MQLVPRFAFALALLASSAVAAPVVGTGKCRFDVATLSFQGTPTDQAKCLLRPVKIGGALDPTLDTLPANLAEVVGQDMAISREAIRHYLSSQNLTEADVAGSLDKPLSHARNDAAGAPQARYFVIHDTSAPYLRNRPFPADLDNDSEVNDLNPYRSDSNARAHIFLNRRGQMLVGHNFGVPWRATKIELSTIGAPAKGLFLHVELIQPRRRDPNGSANNDRFAPEPGFSNAQYDRLALLYVVTSARAGKWLTPAFHSTLDEGLPDAHDDPQHFSLATFDERLGQLLQQLR